MTNGPQTAERVRIDADLVRRLVAAQFPQWTDLAVRPIAVSGWDNRTFHLGERMLARLPSASRYAAQVEKEQAWLPRLAPLLPLAIPAPVAMGAPGEGYRWPWSIYRWIPGETAAAAPLADERGVATALAGFLSALQAIDPSGGPPPGPHNFFRGGPLATYDAEARQAIAMLDDGFDRGRAAQMWDAALAAPWPGPPVWLHGDVTAGNLLLEAGRLSAVIDFGGLGVGDPACDLTIAWNLFGPEGRKAFRAALPSGPATWTRAQGWALWKAAILLTGLADGLPRDVENARRVLGDVLAEDGRG